MRNTLYLSIILALSPCSVPLAAAATADGLEARVSAPIAAQPLARALAARNHAIWLLGSAADAPVAEQIVAGSDGAAHAHVVEGLALVVDRDDGVRQLRQRGEVVDPDRVRTVHSARRVREGAARHLPGRVSA